MKQARKSNGKKAFDKHTSSDVAHNVRDLVPSFAGIRFVITDRLAISPSCRRFCFGFLPLAATHKVQVVAVQLQVEEALKELRSNIYPSS
jgi:hypothetical protein